MAKRRSRKQNQEQKTSLTFPELHQKVFEAVSDADISPWYSSQDEGASGDDNNENDESNQSYSTFVMAVFQCTNGRCSKQKWTSKKVAILIKGFDRNGYNATVFNQRCRSCDSLGTMTLDEDSYVQRIARRLKIWAGIKMAKVYREAQAGRPHMKEFCEGCKAGICRDADLALAMEGLSFQISVDSQILGLLKHGSCHDP